MRYGKLGVHPLVVFAWAHSINRYCMAHVHARAHSVICWLALVWPPQASKQKLTHRHTGAQLYTEKISITLNRKRYYMRNADVYQINYRPNKLIPGERKVPTTTTTKTSTHYMGGTCDEYLMLSFCWLFSLSSSYLLCACVLCLFNYFHLFPFACSLDCSMLMSYVLR